MIIMNSIFFSMFFIITIVIISLLESMIYFMKNKKELKNTGSENQKARLKSYKKRSIYSSTILVILLGFTFIYTKPLSIYKIINLEGVDEIESLYKRGNITGINEGMINKEEIEKVFYVLNNYNYKRNFNHRDVEGMGEFFSITDKDGEFRRVEVWKSGYLRMTTGEVYKINSENKYDLYNELESLLLEF